MNNVKWLAIGPPNPAVMALLLANHNITDGRMSADPYAPCNGVMLLPDWEKDTDSIINVGAALAHNLPIKAVGTLTDPSGRLHDIIVMDTDDVLLWQIVRRSET